MRADSQFRIFYYHKDQDKLGWAVKPDFLFWEWSSFKRIIVSAILLPQARGNAINSFYLNSALEYIMEIIVKKYFSDCSALFEGFL